MFVAKANGQVVAYGSVLKLAADEAGQGTPAGFTSAAFWWIRRGEAGVVPLS
jgi:hypothetical protein